MNAGQISKILRIDPYTSKSFCGVFAADQVPVNEIISVPYSMVINSDPSGQPGQHWMAVYVNSTRNGVFFDSYGRKPCQNIFIKFLKINCGNDWVYNDTVLQNPFLSTCGQFCVYFLVFMSRGSNLGDIVASFQGFIDNDQAVVDFVNENFELETEAFNWDFMINQVCKAGASC